MSDEIHIKEVRAEMEKVSEGGSLAVFSLSFVRHRDGRGGQRGSIKEVARAAKFVRPNKSRRTAEQAPAWKFKTFGVIPLQDLSTEEMITPLITNILFFNGKKVRHYGKQ
jgi:hypothetical protein